MGAVAAVTRPLEEFEEAMRLVRWGMNDCQISRLMGVPRATIKDRRRRAHSQPEWVPGGTHNSIRATDCPICGRGKDLDNERYAYLLGTYLGDGCLTAMPRDVYKLRVTLDERYPLIIDECAAAMRAVRPLTDMKVGHIEKIGCIEVNSHWKHWICLFPQHGRGRKHERKIALEPWQKEIVDDQPRALIRGLIQSDGCRFINPVTRQWKEDGPTKRYKYPVLVHQRFGRHPPDLLRCL